MHNRVLLTIIAAAIAAPAGAQSLQRRAVFSIRGNPGQGKCTLEVVVDGAAEVSVRGDTASLRNIAGQQAQWRRFECTGPMPANPMNFRFQGIDGRGRQQLVGDPRNSGAAVVRIEDPQGGSEGYTFDLTWNEGGGFPGRDNPGGGYRPDPDRRDPDRGGFDRGPDRRRFTTEQAVQVCQDAVREQARDRFRARDIAFLRTAIDDNPGRNDWVLGMFEARRPGRRDERYRFSCSVNFDTGRVRSADIQPAGDRDEPRR